MKKNINKLIIGKFPFINILIFILLLLPLHVYADNIYITCNEDVITSNNISCNIKGNTTIKIIALSLKVQTGSNITFNSFTPSNIWQGDGEGGNIDLYTSNDVLGTYDIGTLNLNIESSLNGLDTNITLYSISTYDDDGKEKKQDNYTKKLRIASSDNNLSNITISSGLLSPAFSSNITVYSVSVNTDKITIKGTPSNNRAKVEGDIGTKKLNYGNNTFKINVISESKQTKTYTINVERINNNSSNTTTKEETKKEEIKQTKSNNTYLKSITIKDNNIDFNKEITNYEINISHDIDNIEIEALPEDNKSKVTIEGNTNLEIGTNKAIITVTSEDNSTREYIINIIKKEEGYILSNNNNISNIEITNYKLNFNKNKQDYTLKIKNEKNLDIKISLEDNKAKYKILNNNNLKNNSIIKIQVTSEDNTIKTYTIKILTNDKLIKTIFIIIILLLLSINIYRIIKRGKNNETKTK